MKKSAVIILSGGIDSTTLCYRCVHEGYNLNALVFRYGQRHHKEVTYAERTCSKLGIGCRIVDLTPIKQLLAGSALTDENVPVPSVMSWQKEFDTLKTTIVPNRNSIFLSLAIAYAVSTGAGEVFFGAHHSDRGVYPDCRKEFVEMFEKSQRLANDNEELRVTAPFVSMKKSEIVKIGHRLGVDFKDTWSCYAGMDIHCGQCSSCMERKKAFSEACIEDTTLYSKDSN